MKKILAVDDTKTIRLIIQKAFKSFEGYELETAGDGSAAFKCLENSYENDTNFDLIISDWNMPFVSGIELLKKVKDDERFSSIPFIMLTAENASERVTQALDQGAIDFLAKPFTQSTLFEKILKHTSK